MSPVMTDAAAKERRPILLSQQDHDLWRTAAWAVALLSTLAAHGALLWYVTRAPDVLNVKSDEPAAVMIDMSPEVQQAFSQADEAVGKPMAEAADEPPPPPDPIVPDMPTVEEAPVDAVAPLPPKPPERPKVEKTHEKKTRKPRKQIEKPSSVAARQSSSAPRSDQHAERTTAASAGASNSAAVADWKSEVAAAINRNKRYPGTDGYPTIRMSIAASGAVSGVSVIASSGASEVDSAAIDTVERASPFPPPPTGATTITFRMNFHHR